MSLANLKEYAMRCANEPELREKAKSIGMMDVDEHMRHAESLGLDWTMTDMAAFRREVVDAEDDLSDLSEDELEMIAGGVCTTTAIVVAGVVGGVAAGAAVGAAGAGAAASTVAGVTTGAGGGGW